MKKLFFILFTIHYSLFTAFAQSERTPFHAYLYNNEYEVYLKINLYDEDVEVPGQELYGPLPGYFGKKHNSFCWVITAAEVKNDSTYILKQEKGSTLKVPKNSKWQKIPKILELKRQKE